MKAVSLCAAAICAAALALSQAAPASTSSQAQSSKAPTVTVDINHFKFHPGTITIRRGTKVVFSNSSAVTHTATQRGSFSTGHIRPGHTAAIRFASAGTFRYMCLIHHYMHGKIVVH
ncbi:MAG: cupredoxin domain-containing protein [Solirubrobacterales bacterium]